MDHPERRSFRSQRGSSSPPRNVSCLGCLGSVAAMMALCTAIIWALNPGLTLEDAAREGILWGGGLSVALTAAVCGLPVLLLVVGIGLLLWRGRPAARDPNTIIIDPD